MSRLNNKKNITSIFSKTKKRYLFFELFTKHYDPVPPPPPTTQEKYSYLKRHIVLIIIFSIMSTIGLTISSARLFSQNLLLYPLLTLVGYSVIYFVISLTVNLVAPDFNIKKHISIKKSWRPSMYPSVDIFLPTCGEPYEIIKNTWIGVQKLRKMYPGKVYVYSLDDAHDPEIKKLAKSFRFRYRIRKNKGWFKKAGNLRNGFEKSKGDFIVIFDADFVPREDFLHETLPHFYNDKKLGIVQTPQFFDTNQEQNWLERGAGAVQEFFYRAVQTSRQQHKGAICVGSNAVYRRSALSEIGGTALIEHSEDVHTGFELRKKGWHLLYIPIVVAKGLCPSEMKGFFKQQYRWCMGSMSLLTSKKFWSTDLSLNARLCYFSGFMYYIHTGLYSILTPLVPLIMLLVFPEQVKLLNYMLIIPSILFTGIILPLWHKSTYGIETYSVKTIYSWAHLFAIIDKITRNAMEWHPTGARHTKDKKYQLFRIGVVLFNLFPSIIWITGSLYYLVIEKSFHFIPLLLSGTYYFFAILKIVLYTERTDLPIEERGVFAGDREVETLA